MKKYNKILALFLLITFLFTLVDYKVFAKEDKKSTEVTNQSQQTNEIGNKESKIVGESIEKREKNVKHFIKDDGTYVACSYSTAVHYKENGRWKDIDNTLIDDKDENGNETIANKDNDIKFKVAKNLKSNKLVSIKKDKYEISWNIENTQQSKAKVITLANSSETISADEKFTKLSKLNSSVIFENAFQDIDIKYDIQSENIKENIILNKNTDIPEFIFNLNLKNLVMEKNEDNSIKFYDERDKKEVIFIMPAPFMFDEKKNISTKIDVQIVLDNNKYKLILKPDKEWLNDADRAYPVTIDPYIYSFSIDNKNINMAYVRKSSPDFNGANQGFVLADNMRTYLSFSLPTLTTADKVTQANIYLQYYLSPWGSFDYIYVHKALGPWDKNTITWNNQPEYDENINSLSWVKNNNSNDYELQYWTITNIVQDWYTYGNNYGLMLNCDTADTSCSLCTVGHIENTGTPSLQVSYSNNLGLEDYFTYHSQSAGRAGTGYVNDNNGNLTFVHNDLSMNGNRMPIALTHVYNSSEKNINSSLGLGWRLNLSKRIDGSIYIDEDGTKHYFSPVLNPSDEDGLVPNDTDGLGLIFIKYSGSDLWRYKVKDTKGNYSLFDSNGYLRKIVDNNGNAMEINYNPDYTISSVIDGVGRTAIFSYTNGKLSSIKDPSNRLMVYEYSEDKLVKITYPDNKCTTYNYDSKNNLVSAVNFDGYKCEFQYYDPIPNKIKKIIEKHTDGTIGKELQLVYGTSSTTFIDETGRKNLYQFNEYGNTTCITDSQGNAQYYKYYRGTNINNKLSLQSKLQKTVTNYILNHNIEAEDGWLQNSSGGSIASAEFTTEAQYLGNRSLKIKKDNVNGCHNYYQQINLSKGKKYTLSGFVKTNGITNTSNKGAYISIQYFDNKGTISNIKSSFINGTNEWGRYEVTFILPQDSTNENISVIAGVEGETGTAYFDCLQLEEGSIANRYNIIENSDFTYGGAEPLCWSKDLSCDTEDAVVLLSDSDYPSGLNNKCFKINGKVNKSKQVKQTQNISGKAGDTLTFGAWIKANCAARRPNEESAYIYIVYYAPSLKEFKIPLNRYVNDWQYLCDSIVMPNDYTIKEIAFNYGGEVNSAYIDGIQLYKESYGIDYKYDSKGNLISQTDILNQSTQLEYNQANDITRIINPKGNYVTSSYDTKHNLTETVSNENIINYFYYDSYGNLCVTDNHDYYRNYNGRGIRKELTYTSDKNYLKTVKDVATGNTVIFNYNIAKGTLDSVMDPKNKTTYYSYDNNLDRLTDVTKTVDDQQIKNAYRYENDYLKTIIHNGFNYNFNFDSLGNKTGVLIGNQALVTNIYEPRTSKLIQANYGNGHIVRFDYDNLDRITSINYYNNQIFTFEFDASGNLGYQEDLVNGVTYKYYYDSNNKIIKVKDSKGNNTSFEYDNNSNGTKIIENIGTQKYTTIYDFDRDDRLKKVTLPNSRTLDILYDPIGRLNSKTLNTGSFNYNTTFSYIDSKTDTSYTTNMLASINNNGKSINYTYDANGNIETITQDGKIIKYYYNELNELTREDNQILNKTIVYVYDMGGNIKTKTEYPYTTGTP
ncbi:DNRLRE domain-containing protein, partial [Fervidicella metallireducens]|uniref:DNRLRE domain-containing protein n=1 Tax=Fervidicella metallireducens TaxID=655338 RepID=UPI0005573342